MGISCHYDAHDARVPLLDSNQKHYSAHLFVIDDYLICVMDVVSSTLYNNRIVRCTSNRPQ